MTFLLLLLLFNSLFIIGMYLAMQFHNHELFDEDKEKYIAIHGKPKGMDKHILWWVRWYGSELPWWVRKMLYACPTCMSSLWSIPVYWYFQPFTLESLAIWLLYVPALAALDTIVVKKFEL